MHCACPTHWHSQHLDGSLQAKEHNEQTIHARRASASLSKAGEAETTCKSEVEAELRAIEEDLAATICVSRGPVDDDDGFGPLRSFGLITKVLEEDASGSTPCPLWLATVLLNVEVGSGVGTG